MKNVFQIIILVLVFLSCGMKKLISQEFSLVGKWKIIEVDSCTKGGYLGAKVEKYKMNHVTGILTFNPNGQGIIESNTQILCKYHKFNWMQKSDTLKISILPNHIEGDSYYKINVVNERTFKIDKIFGCSRYGLGIWYNVTLEKKE
jgi:hypothetical protein